MTSENYSIIFHKHRDRVFMGTNVLPDPLTLKTQHWIMSAILQHLGENSKCSKFYPWHSQCTTMAENSILYGLGGQKLVYWAPNRDLVSTFLPSHWPPWFRRRAGSDTFQPGREREEGEREREGGREREKEREGEREKGEKESALAGRGSGQNRSCLPGRWCFPYWLSGSEIWALGPRKSSHVAPLPILRIFHLTIYHVALKVNATSARTLRKLCFYSFRWKFPPVFQNKRIYTSFIRAA